MGGPPTQRRAPTARSRGTGGTPEHGNIGPHHAAGPRTKKGPPSPAARATRARAGWGGGQAACTHRTQPEDRGREDPPPKR